MAGASSDDRLQQYFDGELSADDAAALRLELEADGELRAKLEGLAHLRTLLVAAAEERGDEVDADALFARIGAELASDEDSADEPSEAAPARPALGVVQGGKTSSAEPARRTNVVWIGVAATLAIAAAVLLVVLRPFDDGGTVPVASAPPAGSEIESVDFGYSTGAIFSVEGQEGEHYAVVWISDEKPELEDETQERIQ